MAEIIFKKVAFNAIYIFIPRYINVKIKEESIVTIGMFDGVHVGHRHLLRLLLGEAWRKSLVPVVVTFYEHPRLVLNADVEHFRLLSTRQERMQALKDCGVERVVMAHFTKETASLSACDFVRDCLLRQVNMKALVLGYDNSFGSKSNNDFDSLPLLAEQEGFEMLTDTPVLLDGIEVSSTKIRHYLAEGDLEMATRMLGAPYSVTGKVAHGRRVGHKLGFPTANIAVEDPRKALPKEGVYAVEATARGMALRGMANLGPQPTFGERASAFEVNFFDFAGDLYGSTLTVKFLRRLRDIVAFDSPEALARQLAKDKEKALRP